MKTLRRCRQSDESPNFQKGGKVQANPVESICLHCEEMNIYFINAHFRFAQHSS